MAGISDIWRRTPPALFPATLGAAGLSLGWRRAEAALGAPGWAADVLLALSGLVFALIFILYVIKIAHRPAALMQDLNPMPGRAAVSAGSMCAMVVAAGLIPWLGGSALVVGLWLFGIALHALYIVAVTVVLARLAPEARKITPVLFLPYVGLIVAPFAGVRLGFEGLSTILYVYSVLAAAPLYALTVPALLKGPTPPPARAASAILLSPTAIAGISGHMLGVAWALPVFLAISLVIAAALAVRFRWLTAGGFTPLWGAFTFPVAAMAGLMVIAAAEWGGVWGLLAWAALAAATVIVLPIWALTLRAWMKGRLAPATGAATV